MLKWIFLERTTKNIKITMVQVFFYKKTIDNWWKYKNIVQEAISESFYYLPLVPFSGSNKVVCDCNKKNNK